MRTGSALFLLAVAAAVLAAGAGPARASTGGAAIYHDVASSSSSNWGGYAVADSGTSATPTTFTSATGSWVQPTVTCTAANTYSAFWVGLGGFAQSSHVLEQAGTEADCVNGQAHYSAWYELVPSPSVTVNLAVNAGDTITGTVAVAGTAVTMTLANETTGQNWTTTTTVDAPDVSSAEWIAEAPSNCGSRGGCRTLPLANFGTATFANASTTAGGTTGTISGTGWTANAITLNGASSGGFPRSRFARLQPAAEAVPGPLSADGSSFAITYQQPAVSTSAPVPRPPRARDGRGYGWGWGGGATGRPGS